MNQSEAAAPTLLEEGGGDMSCGWFNDLTTSLNACSLETYFPIPRHGDISSDKSSDLPLVVGCYQLNEPSESDQEYTDTASSSIGSNRSGELRLYMIPMPSTSKNELQFREAASVLQMESGILDGKWRKKRQSNNNEQRMIQGDENPIFASASASGCVHIHGLTKNKPNDSDVRATWSLNHLVSSEGQNESGLCLALAWNDYLDEPDDQIVSSYSNGEVAIHQISYHEDKNKVPKLEETYRWNAHTLFGCPSEVWTCSFLKGAEHVVLSGADDVSIF